MPDLPLLRILDANFNRASEGLRVVEEYARFVLDDLTLSGECKTLRHELTAALHVACSVDELARARDTAADVGTHVRTEAEYRRADAIEVVLANTKRVEQSLRAIEEYGKVLSPELGAKAEQLRYRAYTLAKTLGVALFRPQMLAAARLYVLIDGGRDLDTFVSRAQALVDAGVEVLQLRDKRLNDRELLARARALRSITRGKTLFIMNDRADLAVLADADGVHVGQEELSVKDARTILGPRRLVGVSTHSIEQARAAVRDGADYIGCGPTFPSGTKTFEHFPGVTFLKEVAAEIRLPAFAIGGITLDNIASVVAAGITRAAIGGALANVSDARAAVEQWRITTRSVSEDEPR
jgi:thiamine-phosphate pyrophosphorylase